MQKNNSGDDSPKSLKPKTRLNKPLPINGSQRITFLSTFQILQYTAQAQSIYQTLKANRIRVGTQDLRIASIVLAHNGVLLTRNLKDFEKVPNLLVQDWSV
jgi:tRNA(fMet)-specific endonuclease VapC